MSSATTIAAKQILKTGSANQIKVPKTTQQHFYIFKSPTIVIPSFEFTRRIFNPIHIWHYKRKIEPNYTKEKFMNGAIQATLLAAISLRERRLDRFREISTESLTNYLRVRLPELSQEELDRSLNFNRRHIVNGFVHSSFFSMNNFVEAIFSTKIDAKTFHSTVVFFIDPSGKLIAENEGNISQMKETKCKEFEEEDPWDQAFPHPNAPPFLKLIRRPNKELIVCNLTLSRNVGTKNPETFGRWRITDINFFDCAFATDKLNTH